MPTIPLKLHTDCFCIPALGFRNCWYPPLLVRDVGRDPHPIRLVADDIAMFGKMNRARPMTEG
jgi:hypothetical protein